MAISEKGKASIASFAKEQSKAHVEHAHVKFIDYISKKGKELKNKISEKFQQWTSGNYSQEAKEDLEGFMTEYVEDLLLRGISEEHAIEQAKQVFSGDSQSEESIQVQAKLMEEMFQSEVKQKQKNAIKKIIGLFYGAFLLLGIMIGALAGFLLAKFLFFEYFWICFGATTVFGLLLGLSAGLLKHALILRKLDLE